MFNKLLTILLLFQLSIFAQSTPKGNLMGKVIDAESKAFLIGANIFIKGTDWGASTDIDGNYSINNVEVGSYVVEVSYIGYKTEARTDILVKSDRNTYLNIQLHPVSIEIGSVVVEAGYFSKIDESPVSSINFSSEEIRRSPGTAGDVSRIMMALPSVAKINDQRNSLIVRGGSPIENTFYVDNIEIPNINHFPVEGSSDGPIGLLNVDFIEDVNFYSGGFSPIYGNRMSSVMDIKFREGDKINFEPQVSMSMAGVGAAVEGPISENANYMFSASRSYVDLIIDAIEEGAPLPKYGDVQGKVSWQLNDKNKITLLGIYSKDIIDMNKEKAIDNDANIYGSTNGDMFLTGLNWTHILNEKGYSNSSIAVTFNGFDRDYNETKSYNRLFVNKTNEIKLSLRNVAFYSFNKIHSFQFGTESDVFLNDLEYHYFPWQDKYGNETPELRIARTENTFNAGVFFAHDWDITNKLNLNYGGRIDYYDYQGEFTISPRASLKYSLDDISSVYLSAGTFQQNIPSKILVQKEAFKKLSIPVSNHYILGYDYLLNESTRLSIEGYYKTYKNHPLSADQPGAFLFDLPLIDGLFLNYTNLNDYGEAQSHGIEFMVQKKMAKDFYGLASVAVTKSQYKDYNNQWHDRIYDNRINFTLEGGYAAGNDWEFSTRWIYAGGAPYTPFDIEKSTFYNKGIWQENSINSERMPDYHSLNIRIDKRFYFQESVLTLYLSVWNVYGRENIAQYIWNEIRNEQDKMTQWSTLPVMGLEFEL